MKNRKKFSPFKKRFFIAIVSMFMLVILFSLAGCNKNADVKIFLVDKNNIAIADTELIVQGISDKDVHDIYMIRSMLEGLCVRWATEHITQEQLEELDEIILLSEYHMDKGHSDQLTELDGRFHQILYEASQSRILDHVLSDFHKYVQLARRTSVKTEERAIKSIGEHNEILNAIKAKDAERAGDLATIHIMHVMENLHIEEE